jgi:hypothetical protein
VRNAMEKVRIGRRNRRWIYWEDRWTYGKYKSVLHGRTSVFALIACIAALKSPL